MGLVSVGNPFPIRDQLAEGPGAQNARMDCVFCSFAACVEDLTGAKYTGDQIVDYVKGPTYQGGGNAAWLEGNVAKHFGVEIRQFQSSDQHRLIAALRDDLAQGHPSLVTIPSRWNTQPTLPGYNPLSPNFSSHVCVAYAIDADLNPAGDVWLMNPWPESYFVDGHRQRVSVAWLQRRLCYGATWPVQALAPEWHDVAAMPGFEDNGTRLRRKGAKYGFVKGFRDLALLHPELFTGVFADQDAEEDERPFGAGSEQILTYVKFVWTPNGGCRLEANLATAA